MNWLTCTPLRFKGDHSFFERDSGLFCRGLQQIGVECQAVMPGPAMEDDAPDLIRVPYENLESPSWWRAQKADGVVLYAWGVSKYTPIIQAIRIARIRVITHLDTSGLLSPAISSLPYFRRTFQRYIASKGLFYGTFLAFLSSIRSGIPLFSDIPRVRHLENADIIATINPMATRLIRRFLLHYGRGDLVTRLRNISHPVLTKYAYNGQPKENIVLSVARWRRGDWAQKDPVTLLKALNLFLQERADYLAIIVGHYDASLETLRQKLCPTTADRISLSGYQTSDELIHLFCRAKISISSSPSEGSQTSMAQHLCCGGSVVSRSGISLSAFYHYGSRSSGRTAIETSIPSLADALALEAESWDEGHRNPCKISEAWIPELHADHVARRAVECLQSLQ